MPKGLLIQPNGDLEVRDINGLDDMYAAIGDENLDWASPGPLTYICYGYALYERNFNAVATALYHETHDTDDPLCGPVLVLGPPVNENESNIPDKYVRRVRQIVAEFGPEGLIETNAPLSSQQQMGIMASMARAHNQAERALKEGRAVDFGGIQIGRVTPDGDREVPWEGSRRTGPLNR
jgi:hypothetical protein